MVEHAFVFEEEFWVVLLHVFQFSMLVSLKLKENRGLKVLQQF